MVPQCDIQKHAVFCSWISDLNSHSVAEWWCPHVQWKTTFFTRICKTFWAVESKGLVLTMKFTNKNTQVLSLFVHDVLKPSCLSEIALNIGPRDARIINKHAFLQWFMQVSECCTNVLTKRHVFRRTNRWICKHDAQNPDPCVNMQGPWERRRFLYVFCFFTSFHMKIAFW